MSRTERILAVMIFIVALGPLSSGVLYGDVVRLVLAGGEAVQGRVYDLHNEFLELNQRLGATKILKEQIQGWSHVDGAGGVEPSGLLLVLDSGHEIDGKVSFDSGTREWVVEVELGGARYPDSQVARTIRPGGICSDGRFSPRTGFATRIQTAIDNVRNGDRVSLEEGKSYLRAAGFFALEAIVANLEAEGENTDLQRIALEERFRVSLPEGISAQHPTFIEDLTEGPDSKRFEVLREALLEHGADLYPLLGLLLLDEEQSVEVRSFSIDVLRRTHRISELVNAYRKSESRAQLALALALGDNGVYIGIPTLIESLSLSNLEARKIALNKLEEYTGETYGFDPLKDPGVQGESLARWQEWWHSNRKKVEDTLKFALSPGRDNPQHRRAADLWRQGILAEADQRLDSAEQFYLRAVEEDPTALGPLVSLGIFRYQRRADFEGGIEYFRRALSKDSGPGENELKRLSYYHLGRIYQLSYDFVHARGAYLKAISLDPGYADAWFDLGKVQYEEALVSQGGGAEKRRERITDARSTLEQGIRALLRYREGLVLVDRANLPFDSQLPFSTRDHNRSLKEVRDRIKAEIARFHDQMAVISLALGEREASLTSVEKAIEIGGESISRLKLLVTLLGSLGRTEEEVRARRSLENLEAASSEPEGDNPEKS